MKSLLRLVDQWLFEEYRCSRQDLAVFRILFASYVLIDWLPNGLWIRELPQAAFSPPVGLAAFFQAYPPHALIVGLNLVTMLFACTLLLGLWTVTSSLGFGIGIVLIESFCYADGKIDHSILVPLLPLTLATSGWGRAFSLDARRIDAADTSDEERRPWLCAIFALLVALGYLTAGVAKVHGGWLSLRTHATQWYLIPNFYVTGRVTPAADWAMRHLPAAGWKAMDLATVLWETSFVLAVPRRASFIFYCALATFFHFGVWQLFDITFSNNAIAYGVFVPWTRLGAMLPAALRTFRPQAPPLVALCAIPFGIGVTKALLDTTRIDQITAVVDAAILISAAAFGAYYFALLGAAGWHKLRAPERI